MNMTQKTHLAFVVNTAAYFISHRLPIAIAALEGGYSIDLYTGVAASPAREQAAVAELSRYPITHWRIKFTSATRIPLSEGAAIWALARRLGSRRPAILHGETPEGVFYGGIAARLARVPTFVAAMSGANGQFGSPGMRALPQNGRASGMIGMRFALGHRNKHVIVQTCDDRQYFVRSKLALPAQLSLIPNFDAIGNPDSRQDGMHTTAARAITLYGELLARAAAS
jgi:hypothetical protein